MTTVTKATMVGGNLTLAVVALVLTPLATSSWSLRACLALAWLDTLLWTLVAARVMSHAERAGIGRHRDHRTTHT